MREQNMVTKQSTCMQGWGKQDVLYRRLVTLLVLINVFVWGFTFYHTAFYVSRSASHEEMLRGLTVDRIDFQSFHRPVQSQ